MRPAVRCADRSRAARVPLWRALLLGGIGGALVSYELAPIFARFYSDETPSLLVSFLVRGGIWAVVGMTAGLALGWGWQGLAAFPGR